MSRPYDAHAPEIDAAHKAIVALGRPMLLSLSPGETPVVDQASSDKGRISLRTAPVSGWLGPPMGKAGTSRCSTPARQLGRYGFRCAISGCPANSRCAICGQDGR